MRDAVTIRVDELRRALAIILEQVEQELGSSIDLGADYYWEMASRFAYGIPRPPALGVAVGQLSDDVQSIRELLARPVDEGVIVWHDLAHACGVLKRLVAMTEPRETA